VSIQTPSHLVVFLFNLKKPFPTLIFAVSFGRRCFLWPHLQVKSAASVWAVSNSSSHVSTQSMLKLAQASSILTTWLKSFPDATHLTLSAKDRHSAPETLSSIYFMSPDM
jgi:hypothetical protein